MISIDCLLSLHQLYILKCYTTKFIFNITKYIIKKNIKIENFINFINFIIHKILQNQYFKNILLKKINFQLAELQQKETSMNGIKFQIDKLIQQIYQLLIKPIESPTRHLFDINYYSFTHQCMHITQMLLERIQIGEDIRMYYQKLIKIMKQASKCRPEEEQSEMDDQDQILKTKDEISTYLNSRKPILQPKDRGQLYKFLATRQQKQKDNQTFLSNMNKVKVNQHLIQKSSRFELKVQQIQTQIQWVHELKIKSSQHHPIYSNQYIKNLQKYFNKSNHKQSQKQKNERIHSSMKKDMQKQKSMKKIQKIVSTKKIVNFQKNDVELQLQVQGKMKSDQTKKSSTKPTKNASKPQKILKIKQKIIKKQQIKQKQQKNQEINVKPKNKNSEDQQIIVENQNQQENLRKDINLINSDINQITTNKVSQNQRNSQNVQKKQNFRTQQNLSFNIQNTENNRSSLANQIITQNISQKYQNQKAQLKLQYNQNQKISNQRETKNQRETIQNQTKYNNKFLPILNKTRFARPLSKVYLAQIKNKQKQNLPILSQMNTIYQKNNNEPFRKSNIKNSNNSYHSKRNYDILPQTSISNHQQRQYRGLQMQEMKQKVSNFLNNSPTNKKQLMQNQRQIIRKLERIKQKSGSQLVNRQQLKQIKHYIQLVQVMHVNACGNGCKHLQRFYSLIKDFKFTGRQQLKISTYLIDNISKK